MEVSETCLRTKNPKGHFYQKHKLVKTLIQSALPPQVPAEIKAAPDVADAYKQTSNLYTHVSNNMTNNPDGFFFSIKRVSLVFFESLMTLYSSR